MNPFWVRITLGEFCLGEFEFGELIFVEYLVVELSLGEFMCHHQKRLRNIPREP